MWPASALRGEGRWRAGQSASTLAHRSSGREWGSEFRPFLTVAGGLRFACCFLCLTFRWETVLYYTCIISLALGNVPSTKYKRVVFIRKTQNKRICSKNFAMKTFSDIESKFVWRRRQWCVLAIRWKGEKNWQMAMFCITVSWNRFHAVCHRSTMTHAHKDTWEKFLFSLQALGKCRWAWLVADVPSPQMLIVSSSAAASSYPQQEFNRVRCAANVHPLKGAARQCNVQRLQTCTWTFA